MNQSTRFIILCCFLYTLPIFAETDTLVIKLENKVGLLEGKKDYAAANQLLDSLGMYFFKKNELNLYLAKQLQRNRNLRRLGEIENGVAELDQALKQIRGIKNQKLDSLMALTYHAQGINHFDLNHFFEAIPFFKKAVELRQHFLPEHHVDFIKGNYNTGNCYYEIWDYNQAIKYHNQALAINLAKEKPIPSRLAKTYKMLGKAHVKKGDIGIGEEYLISALGLYQELYQETPWHLASLYIDFSVFFKNQKQPDQVIKYANQAIETYQQIAEKEDEDWWGMANAYNNLGIAYEIQDRLSEALIAYQKSIAINEKFEGKRQVFIAKTFNNISYIYKKQKAYDLAMSFIDKAIATNQAENERLTLARNYHNKGNLLWEQNQYEAALSFQQKALQQVIYPFEVNHIHQNPSLQDAVINDKIQVLEYFASKAKALEALAHQSDAEQHYKAAINSYEMLMELVDILRYDFQADASKNFLSGQTKIWLEQAIQTALTLADITKEAQWLEKAFAFAERSKAAVLLEAVQRHQAKMDLTLEHPLIQREQEFLRIIAQQEQVVFSLQKDDSRESISSLRTNLLRKRQDLQMVRDSLAELGIYKKQFNQTAFSITVIRQQFLKDDKTSLIQFFVGEKNIYRFVLQKTNLDVTQIPLDFPLQQEIESLRNGIYETYISNENYSEQEKEALNQQYAHHAFQLYQQLFYKNNQVLPLTEKVILIPDGMLGYIPFDALLKQAVTNEFSDFTKYDFLARHHQISYAYSTALLLDAYQQNKRSSNQALLAFVPDYVLSTDNSTSTNRQSFAPLKYSQEEVENILNILPNGQMIAAATKQDFQNLATDYGVLHFSAHAMVNAENPDYSFIAFSQQKKTLDESQLLFINDIYASTLLADMVVLSACETGLGKIEKGEGVMSLARAFTYAGAKSIITSLWRVNDRKTADLMTHFYEYLEAGHTKDEALFLSKRAFIEKGIDVHPYFWAGFVPIGNMSPLGQKSWWWVYGLGGMVLVSLMFLLKRKGTVTQS